MPFRVAMPNSVMKPTSEATDRTPPETNTPATPPINASGRLSMTNRASRTEWKAMCNSSPMQTTTAITQEALEHPRGRLGAFELPPVLHVVAAIRTFTQGERDPRSRFWMSATMEPTSRPAALQLTTILRWTFSRLIVLGPPSRPDLSKRAEWHLCAVGGRDRQSIDVGSRRTCLPR